MGAADTARSDSGVADSGAADSGPADAGPNDVASPDLGTADSGPADAGSSDAGPADTGVVDPVAPCFMTGPGTGAVSACSATATATIQLFTNRIAYEAALGGTITAVDFDCIDTSSTSSSAPVLFSSTLFESTHGAIISGSSGQYADDDFLYSATDYFPSSSPNMYAPGPRVDINGPSQNPMTDVTFAQGGCVSGFGAVFIDADFPGIAESSITAYHSGGAVLLSDSGFSGANASRLFRGVIAFDAAGNPIPVISRVNLINGNAWPEQVNFEGVTLDDFVFGGP